VSSVGRAGSVVVSFQELSLVFHEVDGVTAGGDLGLELGVLELVGGILGTTLGGLVGSKGSNILELGGGTSDVLLVVGDGEGEVEGFTAEVSDSGVELGDLTVESTSEAGESLKSLSLSFSLDGEGGLEVLLDVVEDSEEGIDHTLVGDSWGSLGDHGNDVEDLSVTVGKTLLVEWLESSDVGRELVKGGGLDLEESGFSTLGLEGFLDDGSGLMHHSSDGSVLSDGSLEGLNESVVLVFKSLKHGGSLTELSLSVGLLSLSVSEDWSVDHLESLVLGDGGLKSVSLSVHGVKLSSAGIGDDLVVVSSGLGLVSESLSNFFDHRDNMSNVVFRFKLEFDGVGESFSEISGFDLSKEVGGGVGSDDAEDEDG